MYGNEDVDAEEPQAGRFDAILTCFFIDTVRSSFFLNNASTLTEVQAKNLINYLRIIHRKLAPGGVWINLGPLLWHWENNTTNDPSIELDLEEVKRLCGKIGFTLEVSSL